MRTAVIWLTLFTFTLSTLGCSSNINVRLDSGEATEALPPDRDVQIKGFTSLTDGEMDWNGIAHARGDSIIFREPGKTGPGGFDPGREMQRARSEIESIRIPPRNRDSFMLAAAAAFVIGYLVVRHGVGSSVDYSWGK